MSSCLVSVFVYYGLEYLCECPDDLLIYLVPSCVIYDFRDVVQIMEGLLRMYSNLIVVVCYLLNFLYIWRRDLLRNLEELVFVNCE